MSARGAHRPLELRAFALDEIQAQAHRVGHGEDVGEQDRGVEREARQRLQRDFAGELGVLGHRQEAAGAARAWRGIRAGSARPGASATPACSRRVRGAARAAGDRSSVCGKSDSEAGRGCRLQASALSRVAPRGITGVIAALPRPARTSAGSPSSAARRVRVRRRPWRWPGPGTARAAAWLRPPIWPVSRTSAQPPSRSGSQHQLHEARGFAAIGTLLQQQAHGRPL